MTSRRWRMCSQNECTGGGDPGGADGQEALAKCEASNTRRCDSVPRWLPLALWATTLRERGASNRAKGEAAQRLRQSRVGQKGGRSWAHPLRIPPLPSLVQRGYGCFCAVASASSPDPLCCVTLSSCAQLTSPLVRPLSTVAHCTRWLQPTASAHPPPPAATIRSCHSFSCCTALHSSCYTVTSPRTSWRHPSLRLPGAPPPSHLPSHPARRLRPRRPCPSPPA